MTEINFYSSNPFPFLGFKAVLLSLLMGVAISFGSQGQTIVTTTAWAKGKGEVDKIYFTPNLQLKLSDFTGKPLQNSPAEGLTNASFGYSTNLQCRNTDCKLKVDVFVVFNKENSWIKKSNMQRYVLNHEQHHFDISTYYAWQFKKAVAQFSFGRSQHKAQVDSLYRYYYEEMRKEQMAYDGETSHGRLTDQQAIWDNKITQYIQAVHADL